MRQRQLVPMIALALALSGPAWAQESIDKVFGGITAERGQEYGSLETVNGGITIEEQARVRNAETVNGGINIGRDAVVGSAETVNGGINVDAGARVRSLETVNGGLKLRAGVQVEGDAETVNGSIASESRTRIGGSVETVNGGIGLVGTEVGGDVITTNGDVTVGAGSVVRGGLRIEKPQGSWWNIGTERKPRVVIGPNAVVHGTLVFEREVELLVHATAKTGAITGATAQPYTDQLPERED